MSGEVAVRHFKPSTIVLEEAQGDITRPTEEPTDFLCRMVVIDDEDPIFGSRFFAAADGATTFLSMQHRIVGGRRQTVLLQQRSSSDFGKLLRMAFSPSLDCGSTGNRVAFVALMSCLP
jgi:hypothetical protein